MFLLSNYQTINSIKTGGRRRLEPFSKVVECHKNV